MTLGIYLVDTSPSFPLCKVVQIYDSEEVRSLNLEGHELTMQTGLEPRVFFHLGVFAVTS